jgi:hypothetical protein
MAIEPELQRRCDWCERVVAVDSFHCSEASLDPDIDGFVIEDLTLCDNCQVAFRLGPKWDELMATSGESETFQVLLDGKIMRMHVDLVEKVRLRRQQGRARVDEG